jgi:hypothetical protein
MHIFNGNTMYVFITLFSIPASYICCTKHKRSHAKKTAIQGPGTVLKIHI